MLVHLRRAVILSLIFLAVCGLAYGYAATGLSHVLFRHQADGSITANGSTLIGQSWSGPSWFQGRPDNYTPMATGASNLGPRSQALEQAVAKQIGALKKQGIQPTPGLVTTSGSGIDPDISPADAYAQVNAVAAARHLSVPQVHQLVAGHVHAAELGFLGSDYVDVLELNQALAQVR
ncbi:MAG TPA: potassium-transporting ATPase subunit C [Acidimicrobiales bacterium]|nr:potassium-transporting ATPase subunit C [Acidimicrobiales bacterium]